MEPTVHSADATNSSLHYCKDNVGGRHNEARGGSAE